MPTSEMLKQENPCKSEASLSYLVGFRRTWAIEGASVLKTQNSKFTQGVLAPGGCCFPGHVDIRRLTLIFIRQY